MSEIYGWTANQALEALEDMEARGMSEKIEERLAQLGKIAGNAIDLGASEAQVLSLIADCRNAMVRAQNRARSEPGWERIEIAQVNGPTIEFTGRLLCDTEFADRRAGNRVTLELYETKGGAMVAVRAFERGDGGENEEATVVEPIITSLALHPSADDVIDHQAMRFAVLDAFNWRTEAKAMVRKKLGWDLRQEVE